MTWIVSREASDLCRIFHAKTDSAELLIVHRRLKSQGLMHQMGTHESQCSPAEAASNSLDFMQEIMKKVRETNCEKIHYWYGSNPCFLHLSPQINFGDERGKNSNHPYFHTGHKMGYSCSDSVCRWNKLVSNIDVHRINAKEFPTFPTGWVLLSGEWMDGRGCNAWVSWKILKPLIATVCWILTNVTWLHHLLVQSKSLVWKLSIFLVDVHHFVSLLMLKITG